MTTNSGKPTVSPETPSLSGKPTVSPETPSLSGKPMVSPETPSLSGHFVVTYGYYASSPIWRGGLPLRPLPFQGTS
jgi:hypothetical protein